MVVIAQSVYKKAQRIIVRRICCVLTIVLLVDFKICDVFNFYTIVQVCTRVGCKLGAGREKQVAMHLFSNGYVLNTLLNLACFQETSLESMIVKNLFEEPKTPVRQEEFH